MNWLLKIFIFFIGEYVKGQVVLRAKRRGVVAYLHALQGTRRILILAILAFFVFHAVLLAGIGAFVTGMMLLDLERRTMLLILFGVFLSAFLVPVLFLIVALNERLWYKVSGAKKMVEDLRAEGSEAKAA